MLVFAGCAMSRFNCVRHLDMSTSVVTDMCWAFGTVTLLLYGHVSDYLSCCSIRIAPPSLLLSPTCKKFVLLFQVLPLATISLFNSLLASAQHLMALAESIFFCHVVSAQVCVHLPAQHPRTGSDSPTCFTFSLCCSLSLALALVQYLVVLVLEHNNLLTLLLLSRLCLC